MTAGFKIAACLNYMLKVRTLVPGLCLKLSKLQL